MAAMPRPAKPAVLGLLCPYKDAVRSRLAFFKPLIKN